MTESSSQQPTANPVTLDNKKDVEVTGLPVLVKAIDYDSEDFETAKLLEALKLKNVRYSDGP